MQTTLPIPTIPRTPLSACNHRPMTPLSTRKPSRVDDDNDFLTSRPYEIEKAERYEYGIGTPVDYGKAFHWYQEAAKANLAWGIFKMGEFYDFGLGVPVDEEKAYEQYKMAATKGLPEALYKAAICMEHQIGVSAASREDRIQLQFLAQSFYRTASEKGDLDALHSYGLCQLRGMGTKKDATSGRGVVQAAYDDGCVQACYTLAQCCLSGLGGERDLKRGVELLKESAQYGLEDAQLKFAACLLTGHGVEKDTDLAALHSLLAAFELAFYYIHNHEDHSRIEKGVSMYRNLLKKGLAECGDQILAFYQDQRILRDLEILLKYKDTPEELCAALFTQIDDFSLRFQRSTRPPRQGTRKRARR